MLSQVKKFALVCSAAVILASCADSATINQQAASSYTQEIGKVKTQGAVDTTSATAKRIHKIFNTMRPYVDQENQTGVKFNWELTVIKSNELNAWAMPGGKMAFYTGLVDKLKLTDNEIATVMGHEMAHALKEHGKKKTNLAEVTNVVGSVVHSVLSTQIGSDMSGLAVGLVSDWGLNKPYSRSNETEADEVGLMLMAKAGYNPEAAPAVWDKMKKASEGQSRGVLESLASTHPSDEARQENLLRLMPEAVAIYKARKS